MENVSPQPRLRQRVLDIVIASLIGATLGAAIAWRIHPDVLIVDRIHAKKILVDGDLGTISINGSHGISLHREDYASMLLWFHEPGKGGPAIWISGKEPQAFKATPSGQEMVPLERDDNDRP